MASVGSGDYCAAGSPIPRRFHGSLSACGQPIPVILGQHPEIVRRFHKIRSHYLNLGQARQPNGRKIRHRNLTARSVLPALRSRQFPELKELITRLVSPQLLAGNSGGTSLTKQEFAPNRLGNHTGAPVELSSQLQR